MIKQETIDKINETARIEEVVGDFVSLKKRGANLLGLCPFHNEKTPSFTVSPAKGIYKCFGCGEAGNAVNFIMNHEHYSYPEALRYLADKYNIEVEETRVATEEDIQQKNERESLYIANAFAQRYYTDQLLNTEEGQTVGLSYFKERGFNKEMIEKFQLGYAPRGGDTFTQQALKEGYQLEILEKAGLTSTKYDKPRDFFRERVQFTIHNFSGKVVGFGGRTLSSDKKIPKYVNTPETDIYNKSKILYGLFFGKTAVRREDECILVEGYTDVISMHQAGIENVVASSGTSLTVEQIRLIKRLTPNITIIYDGDQAGIKAALRGIDLILEEDMNVQVVALPEGEDPDSFVRQTGAAGFTRFKEEKSRDFILFKAELLLDDAGNDPVKRTEVIRDMVGSIALIPDTIKRTLYIQECSKLLNLQEQLLITEINKLRRKKLAKDQKAPQQEYQQIDQVENYTQEKQETAAPVDGLYRQERDIVRLLLTYGNLEYEQGISVAQVLLHELAEEKIRFTNDICESILTYYEKTLAEEREPEPKDLISQQDEKLSGMVIELMHSPYEISPNWAKMHDIIVTDARYIFRKDIRSSLCRYKVIAIDRSIKENKEQLTEAYGADDHDRVEQLLTVRTQLLDTRKQLGEILGTVILK